MQTARGEKIGQRGASWDFPRAGSQCHPFYLLLGAAGSPPGRLPGRPLPGGCRAQGTPLRFGERHPCASAGGEPCPWCSRGWGWQQGLAAPEHLVPTPVYEGLGRSWAASTGPTHTPQAASEGLHMGFWGRAGNTASFVQFSISRSFNREHRASFKAPCIFKAPSQWGQPWHWGPLGLQ